MSLTIIDEQPPLESMRMLIADRSRYDHVMGLFPIVALALVPVIVYSVLGYMEGIPRYSIMQMYPTRMITVMLGFFVISILVFRLTKMQYDHCNRDRVWRHALIRYVDKIGLDSTALRAIDTKADETKTGITVIPLVCLIMMAVWVNVYYFILPAFGDPVIVIGPMTLSLKSGLSIAGILPGVAILLLSLVSSLGSFFGPYDHEKDQIAFTEVLSDVLAKAGITVEPMRPVVSKYIKVHRWIIIFTAGIYYPVAAVLLIRAADNHMMNQHSYETRLLQAIETGSKDCFEGYALEAEVEDLKSQIREVTNIRKMEDIRRMTKKIIKYENKMPAMLRIAEIFLLVMTAVYILKMTGLYLDVLTDADSLNILKLLKHGYPRGESFWVIWKTAIIITYTVMFALTVKAVLNIESRRAIAWRRVVRTCITFTIPIWLSEFVLKSTSYVHMFDFDPVLTTAILYCILLMMVISVSIKRYYTPAGYDIPKIDRWFRFLIIGKLIRIGKDRFDRTDDFLRDDANER